MAAAHCYENRGNELTGKVKTNTVRDGTPYKELVEVKRVYKHPLYSFPRLYNDIALLELGRRIEYDHDRFGDSPSCIDRNVDVVEKVAIINLILSHLVHRNRWARCKDTDSQRTAAEGRYLRQRSL